MKINVIFNSKSKAKGVSEAIEIAKKHHGKLEGNFYKLDFESFENEDLIKLKNLIGHLKETQISVAGVAPKQQQIPAHPKKEPTKKIRPPKTTLSWINEAEIFNTSKHIILQDKIRDAFEEGKQFQKQYNFNKAIESYLKVLRLDHHEGYYFCEAFLDIGRLYYLQNKFQETFEVLDKFFTLYPDWDKEDGSLELYLESSKKINNPKKVKDIEQIIEERKKSKISLEKSTKPTLKTLLDYNLDNNKECRECFNQAITMDITNFDFWVNLGQAFKTHGEELKDNSYYENAIECYKRCIEIDPHWHDALLNIGVLYEIIGKLDYAIVYYKKVMDEDNVEKIEKHEKILKADPKAENSWISMAKIYASYEIYSKAIDCYKHALEIDSKNESVWISLGKTYLDAEEVDNALEAFKEVIKINPERKEINKTINKIRNNKIDDVYEILAPF